MKTRNFLFGALAVAGLFMMNSCQKDEETQTLSEQIAEEDAGVEEMINVFDEQIDFYASSDIDDNYATSTTLKSASTEIITYPNITVVFPEETRWPVVITIDYGPENINVGTGKGPRDTVVVKMRGKIMIEKTGPHFATGSQTSVSFDGYYVNDIHVEGTETYLNSGLNAAQNPVFTWTNDLTFTLGDFEVFRTVNKTREMIAGDDTKKNIWDDEFMVNGTVTGGNSNGWVYTHTVADLHRKRVCRFPVSGTVVVVNSNTTFTLDYGTGECDALATVTDAKGNIYNIVLGRKWVRQ